MSPQSDSTPRPTGLLPLLLITWLCGCVFDAAGLPAASVDGNIMLADGPGQRDGGGRLDGAHAEGQPADLDEGPPLPDHGPLLDKGLPPPDKGPPPDAKPPLDTQPPCYGLTCALGCNQPANRCWRIKASNFDASKVHLTVSATLAAGSSFHFDTDSGLVQVDGATLRAAGGSGTAQAGVYWEQQPPVGGFPGLGVFGVDRLTLSAGSNLTIAGGRAFALYSRNAVTIDGTVSAVASGASAGSGGYIGGANNGAAGAACFGGEGGGGGQSGTGSSQKEAGGAGGALSQESGTSAPNLNNGGGGGGAAGRIRLNGKVVNVGAGAASPTPSTNNSLATW